MTNVVFVGNCQAQALFGAYRDWIAPERDETVHYVPAYEDADEAAKDRIRQADVVALQVTDTEQKVSLADQQITGRVVMFPMVTAFFLWPFHNGSHPRDKDIPPTYYKTFTGECGDRWLDKRIARGDEPQAILERYRDLDVVKEANLDRLVELAATQQRQRDARADMGLGDYIMANLASEQVFEHMHHPNLRLFALMVREVFSRMDSSSAQIERALSHYRFSPLPAYGAPVHPRIAEHLGLKWASNDLQYRFVYGERVTWNQYCQRYIAHDWNEPLHRCLALARQDLSQAELEALAADLEAASARYESSEGYCTLSDTLQRLGDLTGSLAAIRRAVSLEPLWSEYAIRHAKLLVATGHLEEGMAAAEDVAAWRSQIPDARITLLEAYYKIGRIQDALQEARATFALHPSHPHVVRWLTFLEETSRDARPEGA